MNLQPSTRRLAPGDLPARVAGAGDRWRITRTRFLPMNERARWSAGPIEARVLAFQDRKHALFATHQEALEYALARHRGIPHDRIAIRELGGILRSIPHETRPARLRQLRTEHLRGGH